MAEMADPIRPILLDRERALRWSTFMVEELGKEYSDAVEGNDIKGVLDALADGMVFLLHCVCDHGLQYAFEGAFDEVMRSNFTKFKDGKAEWADNGKLSKPEGYTPPNLLPILCRAMGLMPMNIEVQVMERWMEAVAGLTVVGEGKYIVSTLEGLRSIGVYDVSPELPVVATLHNGKCTRVVDKHRHAVLSLHFTSWEELTEANDSDHKLLLDFLARR